MDIRVDSPIGKAVAEYTGETVTQLEVIPDPVVAGVFAVRASLYPNTECAKTRTIEFLIKHVALHTVTEDDLEEVEFETWPPQSVR